MPVLFPGARQCPPPSLRLKPASSPNVGWLAGCWLSLLLGDHEAVSNLVSQGFTGK